MFLARHSLAEMAVENCSEHRDDFHRNRHPHVDLKLSERVAEVNFTNKQSPVPTIPVTKEND